jgi:uncharacterized YigZ family protein
VYFRCYKNKQFVLSSQSYISLKKSNPIEIKEKGSKFIGLAACCRTEKEVKSQLEFWHLEHPGATHICYAYRLGIAGEKFRANDDGEPNNSAGAPILGQILSAKLTNVLVGVVRYYGGTKLGVGGLIQTYKQAAKEVLDHSEKIEYQLSDYYGVSCTFEDMPLVMSVLKRNQFDIVETNLLDNCQLVLKSELNHQKEIENLLAMFASVEIKFLERK